MFYVEDEDKFRLELQIFWSAKVIIISNVVIFLLRSKGGVICGTSHCHLLLMTMLITIIKGIDSFESAPLSIILN